MEEELQQTEADKSKKEAEELKAKIAQQKEIKAFNARVKERYNQYQGSIRKYAIGDSNMQDRTIYYEYNMVRDDYKGVLSGENPFKQKPKPKLIEATLLSVHDGDTGWFQIGNEKPFKVRFANVHAREVDNPVTGKKGEKGGIADKEFLLSKIPIGTTVGLASSGYDSYDRKVMSIYHGDGLNERLDVTMAVGGASQPADNYTSSELEWYKINRNKFIPNTNGEYVIDGAYNIPKPNGTKPAIVPTVPVQQQPINSPMPLDDDLLYPPIDTSIGVMPLDSNLTPPIDTMGMNPIDTVPLSPIDTMGTSPIDTMSVTSPIDTIPASPANTPSYWRRAPSGPIGSPVISPTVPVKKPPKNSSKQQEKKGAKDFNMVYPYEMLSSTTKGVLNAVKKSKNVIEEINEINRHMFRLNTSKQSKAFFNNAPWVVEKIEREEREANEYLNQKIDDVINYFNPLPSVSSDKENKKSAKQTNVISSVKKGVLSALGGVKDAFAKANEVLTPYDDYRGVLAIYDENIKRHEKRTGEKLTRDEYWEKVANKDAYTPFGLNFGKDKPGEDDEKVIEFFEWMGLSVNNSKETVSYNPNNNYNGPMARAKNDSEKYNPFDFNFGMGAAQDYFVNNRNYKVSQQVSKPVKEIIEENENNSTTNNIIELKDELIDTIIDNSNSNNEVRNSMYWKKPKYTNESYIIAERKKIQKEGLMLQKKYGFVRNNELYKNMSNQPIQVQNYLKNLKRFQEDFDNYNKTKNRPEITEWIKTDYAIKKEEEAKALLLKKLSSTELNAWDKLGNYGKLALLQKYNIDYYWLDMDLVLEF